MTYSPPVEDLARRRSRALIAGIVGLVACGIAFVADRNHFYISWLISYLLFFSISLGCLGFVMIQHLTGGVWGVFRRIFEAGSRTMPLMILLFIPIVIGVKVIFPWANPEVVARDEILEHRELYQNLPFFLIRAAVYLFGGWAFAALLHRWSVRQDEGDARVNLSMQRLSGGGIVYLAITAMFAGIDWIMGTNAHWYSTIFGFLMLTSFGLAALSFTIIIGHSLVKNTRVADFIKPSHFHDLGKLMFAFIMLWAYFNFSQYLLTVYANLPQEIPYMIARTSHGWGMLALFLVLFQFAIPWLLLLSRDLKRRSRQLVILGWWILIVRFFDLYMMVAPEFLSNGVNVHTLVGEHFTTLFFHWTDLAAPLAMGGLWMWAFYGYLAQRPLFALGDPYLRESLESGAGGH
jgi:hypothetical protein